MRAMYPGEKSLNGFVDSGADDIIHAQRLEHKHTLVRSVVSQHTVQ